MSLLLLFNSGVEATPDSGLRFWIDVEDSSGNRLGDGPIATASAWQYEKRLNRIGAWSFDMPAADSKAALLTLKRVVRCRGMHEGSIKEFGAGIIQRVDVKPGAGRAMLQVSGDDLLVELTYRTVGDLEIVSDAVSSPTVVFLTGATYDDLTNVYDGDDETSETIVAAQGKAIIVGSATKFDRVRFNFDTANADAADTVLIIYKVQGTETYNWLTSLNDSTFSGNVQWGKSGIVQFAAPPDWGKETIEEVEAYYLYFSFYSGMSVVISEIEILGPGPASTGLATLMDLAPAGWTTDSLNGYSTTGTPFYAMFEGQTLFNALVTVADFLGERFRLGVGRKLVWLRTDTAAAPVRASQTGNWLASLESGDVAVIVNVAKATESTDVVTRVYPYGPKIASLSRNLSLSDSTDAEPSGYTLDTDANYLEIDAGVAAYGRIERQITWDEITLGSETAASIEAAGNALLARAKTWLAINSVAYASYTLAVIYPNADIEPGMLLPVAYHEFADGYHAVNIDASLVVLAVRLQIDRTGVRTVQIEADTVGEWHDEQNVLARLLDTQPKRLAM